MKRMLFLCTPRMRVASAGTVYIRY